MLIDFVIAFWPIMPVITTLLIAASDVIFTIYAAALG